MIKKIFFSFFILFHFSIIFSQEQPEKKINNIIQEKVKEYSTEINFKKASLFFIEKKWDSTLVYAMRQLNASTTQEITDYCHYYRGVSFQKKKILKEAQKEFSFISSNFHLYNRVLLSLGDISLELNEYKKAISYFKNVEKLPDFKKQYFKKIAVPINLGLCYLHLKEFNKAKLYLLKGIKILESNKDTLLTIRTYSNIATLFYEQYKDHLAIPYYKKAYQLSKTTKSYDVKMITAKNMAVVEENRKNYLLSLTYRKEYEKWKDSLNDQNKIWEVAELEKQFAIKQKQKEVSLLQAENKVKIAERNGLLYSAIVLLLLLSVGIYFYREKIKTNKIILAQKKALNTLNATKDKLFSIVSHDLRSSVNALKTSNTKLLENLKSKNLEELDTLLHQNSTIANGAYNMLDNLLHWALLQTKQSYFKINAMHLFFIVEQTAYNYKPLLLDKNISLQNNILKNNVVYADQESLKIVLRNLLDNAIKFSPPNTTIKIYSKNLNNTYYDLIIEDSGLGMDQNTCIELLKDSELLSKKKNDDIIGTGLGLQLSKSMIKKNNGKFSIESELGKGTKMIVSLPKSLLNGSN